MKANKLSEKFSRELAKKQYPAIPERILSTLYNYIDNNTPTGGFVRAVLCNDLKESLGRADERSRAGLFEIVQFLYNEAPGGCWGSPEKVKKWLNYKNEEK